MKMSDGHRPRRYSPRNYERDHRRSVVPMSDESSLAPTSASPSNPTNRQIGPYRLIRPLRASPLGQVFLASQQQPMRRQVTIQLLGPDRGGHLSFGELSLGRLQHPFIAQVFEAGETDDGRPFLVMEWVDGLPIDVYCDRSRSSLSQRLRLLCCICEGVQHAHQKGILHGGLDTSSVLIVEVDGEPIPKIIDFALTQASGEGDLRGDVYDLGVLLYRLLVDLLPLAGSGRVTSGSGRRPPSRRYRELPTWRRSEVAGARHGKTPGGLARRLRGDLDAIALKAVEEEPDKRYDSAAQLADDIQRSLDGRPVNARSKEWGYGLWTLVQRHGAVVSTSALILLLLTGGIVMRTAEVERAQRAVAEARQAQLETEQVVELLGDLFGAADPEAGIGATEAARALLDRGTEGLRQEAVADPAVRATLLRTVGSVYEKLGLLDEAAELLKESLEESQRLGDTSSIADSLVALGEVRGEQSELEAAREHLQRALTLRTDALGPDHAAVAEVLVLLGTVAEYEGDYEASKRELERALTIREAAFGPRSEEVAATLDLLAITLLGEGHFERAERRIRRALDIWQELYGTVHPKVARGLNSLGVILNYQDRFDDGEAMFRRSLEIRRQALDPHHPELGQSLNNLALCLLDTEHHDEGMALMEQALEIWRRALGELHPRVSRATYNLGDFYMMDDDLDAAEPLLRRALEITLESHGPDHLQAAFPFKRLGDLMERRGRFAESEGYYRKALAIRQPKLNQDHPVLLGTVYGLADILRKQGREVEALDLEARYPALEVQYPEWAGEEPGT